MIQWKRIAEDLGFHDTDEMWRALYPRYSVAQLAVKFSCSVNSVRGELGKVNGIVIQSRGGKRNVKFLLDEDMLLAIRLRGVPTVAKERGLDVTSVYKSLRKAGLNGKLEQIPKWPGQKPKPVPQTVGDTTIPAPFGEGPEIPTREQDE